MSTTNTAIIREEKMPKDSRTPLTSLQAKFLKDTYPDVNVYCQGSSIRCFSDDAYHEEGIEVVNDVSHCDIFLGVKEVNIQSLISGKTYLFFSHTIKKQHYNQKLLMQIIEKKIRLIDYESLTNERGIRVIAFGRWAGIVGAYNALWTYGEKYGTYTLKRAFECADLAELFAELQKVQLPPIKILITGNGRVSKGSLEILEAVGVKKIDPEQYIFQQLEEPVYTQIDVDVYTKRKDKEAFSFEHFFQNPQLYRSNFKTFAKTTDLLIMGSYWNPKAPRLFEIDEAKEDWFKIRVIADLTCDINGSIPATIRSTTIENPVYDYHLKGYDKDIIKNATIATDGNLTEKYQYLSDYVTR